MSDYTKGIVDIIYYKFIRPKFIKGEIVEITNINMIDYLNNLNNFLNGSSKYIKSNDIYYFFRVDDNSIKLIMTPDFINYYVKDSFTNIDIIDSNYHRDLMVYDYSSVIYNEFSLSGSMKDSDRFSVKIYITEDYHIIVRIVDKFYYVLPNRSE